MPADPKLADRLDPRQIEIYRKMTPEDKMREFTRLYWQSWEFTKAGVKMRNPDWNEEEIPAEVRKIFIRTVT